MAAKSPIIFWLKVGLWIGALIPLGLTVYLLLSGGFIAGDPVEEIQHRTGTTALILLFLTLCITPVRRLSGWNKVITFRRPLGLFAFFYSTLHAFSYFVFDQQLSLAGIFSDVAEHPWVLVGFTAFVLLFPMAFTSTPGAIRRMGGKKWALLHKLIYPISILGVLHFLWQIKLDSSEPIIYAVILAVILGSRFLLKKPIGPGASSPPKPRTLNLHSS